MTKSQPSDTFQPGDVLNNTYRIEAVLGRGGTSEVYRARSEISGRIVALKVLSSEFSGNDDYLVLMTREEEIRDVRHDAVVRYSENNRTQDGHVYLVMDFIDGPGLDEKMRTGGMSAEDLLTVAARVAEGLVATHARNIVHRDLSPDNIILRNGNPAEAVIIDFGIARDTNPGAATIVGNEFAGKYAYAAPEQLSGNSDARSDIYALGALLLATYRGAPPDVGRNPMEVIRKKSQPLDTEGVPEPLKTLIERMTQPDPDARLQTAGEVIEAIDPLRLATQAPRRPPTEPPVRPKGHSVQTPRKAGKSARLGVLGLAFAGLVGVALLAWRLGYLAPLIGPSYPVAAPYTLVAEKPADAPLQIVGHVPTETDKARLEAEAAALGGTAELTLASGAIAATWGDDMLSLIASVAPLEEWRIAASDQTVQVTGLTSDADLQAQLQASLDGPAMPAAFQGSAEILLVPRVLAIDEVDAVLAEHADCGPLVQSDAPAGGYPAGAEVVVRGRLSSEASRIGLADSLRAIAGDRTLALDVRVLSPELCLVHTRLPQAPEGGFAINFGYGDRDAPNATGAFAAGDNPVIDIGIPPDATDGYLWVSIVDVTGNVYHLLPNINRTDNSVRNLRLGREGTVEVRVAYGLEEAKGDRAKLAFLVDETFGQSTVVVIHSEGQLFAQMQPTTESLASYAEALDGRLQNGGGAVLSIDTRLIESR